MGHSLLVAGGAPEPTLQHRLLGSGRELVFLFFVLSGCLLYTPFTRLLGRNTSGRRVDLKRYFVNRAVRLLPLYYFTTLVLYLFPPYEPMAARTDDWWRFALFLQFTSEESAGKLNGVLWTLVVEFQFYLLLPLLAYVVARLSRGSVPRAAAVVGVIALASFALRTDRMLTETIEPTDPFGRNALPSVFMFMAGGMLLALLRRHLEETGRRLPGTTGGWLLVAVPLWLAAIVIRDFDPLTFLAAVMTVGACVLPLQGTDGVLARALDWRPLTLIGLVSYSLYLWHGAVITWLAGPLPGELTAMNFKTVLVTGLVVSLAVSVVSYNLIERPFLSLRRRWISGRGPVSAAADRQPAAAHAQAEALPAAAPGR